MSRSEENTLKNIKITWEWIPSVASHQSTRWRTKEQTLASFFFLLAFPFPYPYLFIFSSLQLTHNQLPSHASPLDMLSLHNEPNQECTRLTLASTSSSPSQLSIFFLISYFSWTRALHVWLVKYPFMHLLANIHNIPPHPPTLILLGSNAG